MQGSSNAEIPSMFKSLVDTRRQQRFTGAQMIFLGPGGPAGFMTSARTWTPERIAVWREVDQRGDAGFWKRKALAGSATGSAIGSAIGSGTVRE